LITGNAAGQNTKNSREKAQKTQNRIFGLLLFAFSLPPIRKGNTMKDIMELSDEVRQTAFAIHCYHKNGHLEKVYENALAHRLRKSGLDVKQQHPLNVYDEDGTLIGEYYADMLVDNRLIVELKAAKTLADEHTAQVLGYLRASRIEHVS
jgi:GxxExxY protein